MSRSKKHTPTGDEATAYGVVFPDLPGCFSAGDTLGDALANAREAAAAWLETTLANEVASWQLAWLDSHMAA